MDRIGSIRLATRDAECPIITPMATGKVVIRNMAMANEMIETSGAALPMKWTTAQVASAGTVAMLSRDTTGVSEIDNATSPTASLLTLFQVTPPGQYPASGQCRPLGSTRPIMPTRNAVLIPKVNMPHTDANAPKIRMVSSRMMSPYPNVV